MSFPFLINKLVIFFFMHSFKQVFPKQMLSRRVGQVTIKLTQYSWELWEFWFGTYEEHTLNEKKLNFEESLLLRDKLLLEKIHFYIAVYSRPRQDKLGLKHSYYIVVHLLPEASRTSKTKLSPLWNC